MSIQTVVVTQSQYTVVVSASASIITLGSEVSFLGSAMTGSEGSGRTYTRSGAVFATNAKVFVGTANGLMLVPSSKWVLSTVVLPNDKITVNVDVYNDSEVVVFT